MANSLYSITVALVYFSHRNGPIGYLNRPLMNGTFTQPILVIAGDARLLDVAAARPEYRLVSAFPGTGQCIGTPVPRDLGDG